MPILKNSLKKFTYQSMKWLGLTIWPIITCYPVFIYILFSWDQFRLHDTCDAVPEFLGGRLIGVDSNQFMPSSARNLEFDMESDFGVSIDWKCDVGEIEFLRFAKEKNWHLTKEVPPDARGAWRESYDKSTMPERLFYTFVPSASSAGLSILYDRTAGVMYGNFSSR